AQLSAFARKGYLRAYIDGDLQLLSPLPTPHKDDKHTIKVIVDNLTVKPQNQARLLRGVETALRDGDSYGEFFALDAEGRLDLSCGGVFSSKGGCPVCGFSWPRLDSRHFSINSLGKCSRCRGLGELSVDDETEDTDQTEVSICT